MKNLVKIVPVCLVTTNGIMNYIINNYQLCIESNVHALVLNFVGLVFKSTVTNEHGGHVHVTPTKSNSIYCYGFAIL